MSEERITVVDKLVGTIQDVMEGTNIKTKKGQKVIPKKRTGPLFISYQYICNKALGKGNVRSLTDLKSMHVIKSRVGAIGKRCTSLEITINTVNDLAAIAFGTKFSRLPDKTRQDLWRECLLRLPDWDEDRIDGYMDEHDKYHPGIESCQQELIKVCHSFTRRKNIGIIASAKGCEGDVMLQHVLALQHKGITTQEKNFHERLMLSVEEGKLSLKDMSNQFRLRYKQLDVPKLLENLDEDEYDSDLEDE